MSIRRSSSGLLSRMNPLEALEKKNLDLDAASGSSSLGLQVPSLGRPVSIGSLYNAKTDQFNIAVKLWSQDSMASMTAKHNLPMVTTIRKEKATSFTERANLLAMTPAARLSFLSDKTTVEGSGQLLIDSRTSLNSLTITLEYTKLTKVKDLNVGITVDHSSHLKATTDTHVVSRIQYGAKAFFTFELDVNEQEHSEAAKTNFERAVDHLKNFLEPNNDPSSFNAEKVHDDVTLFSAIKCRYFGDFNIDPTPLTLSDVFRPEVIKVLTSDNVEVPLEIFLTPLSQFGRKTSVSTPQIASEQIDKAGDYYQLLKDVICTTKARISQLTETPWHALRETLGEFLTSVETYKIKYCETLSKLLPKAQESSKECEKFSKLLSNYRDNSPFSAQLLKNWIMFRERECTILVSYFNALQAEGTKLTHLDINLMNFKDCSGYLAGIKDLFVCGDSNAASFESGNFLLMVVKFSVSPYLESLQTYLKDNRKLTKATDADSGSWIQSNEHAQATDIVSDLVQILRQNATGESPYVCVAVASGSSGESDGRIQVNKLCKKGQQLYPWEPPSQPDKLSCLNVTDTVAELSWLPVSSEFTAWVQYKVEIFRTDVADCQPFWSEITDSPSAKALDLCPDAEFEARVSTVTPYGHSKTSINLKFRTLPPICSYFVRTNWCLSTPLAKQKGEEFPGDIYQINKREVKPPESWKCDDASICPMSFEVGDSKQTVKPPKFLLIVGETGTDKSTFINGIANAFYKVKYNDKFRLKLIAEPEEKTHSAEFSEAHSQASVVTVYTLFPVDTGGSDSRCRSGMDCPLTIIDTPGFGDKNHEKDIIIKKISEVFGANESSFPGMTGLLHAIGFVVKASQNKITLPKSILSLFGDDAKQIVLPYLTLADSSERQALAALKEDSEPHDHYLKFNNGMLYADNALVDNIKYLPNTSEKDKLVLEIKLETNSLNWKQGYLYYLEFFEVMAKMKDGKSLKETKKDMKKPKTLEICIEGLMGQVKIATSMLTLLQEKLNLIETLDDVIKDSDMKQTRNVKEPKVKQTQVTTGRLVTPCMTCSKTCDENCANKDDKDKDKIKCNAMDSTDPNPNPNPNPKSCMWDQHCSHDYFFEVYEEDEVVTVQDIAHKYQVNMNDRDAKKQMIQHLLQDFEKTYNEFAYNLVTIHKCLQTLDQLALRQYPLSVVQYIDNLTKVQENEKQPGWESRVKYLKDARERAKILAAARDGQDPFGETREKVLERCKEALATV